MTAFITWFFILEILGAITLPIAFRLFRWLPDRGYALAKPLGLLLTGYGLWVLVSFRFLRNTRVAIVLVMLIVAAGAVYLVRQQWPAFRAFLRLNRRVILVTELLFLIGFAAWTVFRAYNPALDHTEKPMELAFLNAILRSDTFPPHDPWLAGYTISYYYFGYLIAAVLTKLAGTAPAVAFNLMIAALFALTLTGAYSLTYNLIEGLRRSEGAGGQGGWGAGGRGSGEVGLEQHSPSSPLSSLLVALFGPLFVAVAGNLEGFLDALHSRGLGSAAFWEWLDIQDLSAPATSGGWIPERNWWWWRASRVITQRDLLGNLVEIIDEFPLFSFLLGDMHPHVLALPFAFLALAVALNILFGTGRDEDWPFDGAQDWLPALSLSPLALFLPFLIGAFGFLHSWDFPTYLLLVTAAYGLRRYIELGRLKSDWWRDMVWFAVWLAALSIILFVLFHIGPRPYTGGVGLVGVVKTKLRQFTVMFGLFLFVVVSFLILQVRAWFSSARNDGVSVDVWAVIVIAVGVAGLCFVLGWWTAAALSILIGLGVIVLLNKVRLAASEQRSGGAGERGSVHPSTPAQLGNPVAASTIFVLLLIVTALALTFATEFVFVRDRFGSRMNTVFKFYYQAWVMLAVASAFGVYYLVRRWRSVLRWAWVAGFGVVLLATLVYPVLAGYTRAGRFEGERTLNGLAYVESYQPAEYAAIQWLQESVVGAPTILEALGDSYRADTSRISAATGLPTLLGWGGHETQWRSEVPEMGQRQNDVATIYRSLDARQVQRLLEQYDVKYVYVGPAESRKYGLAQSQIDKFDTFMEQVFARGSVRIYRR
ncbi:MAG: hypothetical protein MAG451_01550 [Anaerolineales bacterium]|nr:hypothetical protein [Anaerolineales bacterium]